jgi:TraB/PrgY/gumN family
VKSQTVKSVRARVWLFSGLVLCGHALQAAQEHPTDSALEEVLVVGEHPGPGLWKVSRRSHTLFVLGTHVPLPKDFVWRSKEVESVIARSTEILGAYSVSLRVDQESAFQSRRGKLQEVLPRRMYVQWRALRAKYIGDDAETERLLPTAAALLLQARAFERSGLTYGDEVWRKIYQLAQAHRVPVWQQSYETRPVAGEWRRPRQVRQNGVKYLGETMNRLSSDIRDARARANAWATGDVAVLKSLVENDASYAKSLAYSWPFLSDKEVQRLHTEAENKLLAAIERAMNRNETTFAALPIYLLLGEQGLLARLRAGGCSIEEPA